MEIVVEFLAYLIDYSPTGERKMTISMQKGAKVENLWAKLNIPEKIATTWLVNGIYCNGDKVLKGGDVVTILPIIDGG